MGIKKDTEGTIRRLNKIREAQPSLRVFVEATESWKEQLLPY